jgi:pilus assembly protein CpaB
MHVDVLVSGAPGGKGDTAAAGPITRTLLQNIQVLSAGQNFQKDAEGKPVLVQVVNLLVTPEQAEILNLATEQSIQLVLRNPTDTEIVKTPGASTYSLFAGGAPPPPPAPRRPREPRVEPAPVPYVAPVPPAPKTVTIEVFAGDRRTESTVRGEARP